MEREGGAGASEPREEGPSGPDAPRAPGERSTVALPAAPGASTPPSVEPADLEPADLEPVALEPAALEPVVGLERLVLWHRAFPPRRVEQDEPAALAAWTSHVQSRLQASGGALLGSLGGAVAVAFELTELTDALDAALALLDEAEASDAVPGGFRVAFGAGTGELLEAEERVLGAAIDRAQLLANRARRGELVVDAGTRELASTTYLFGRSVGTGAAALRGSTLDRQVPRRAACRLAIAYLEPASPPPALRDALAPLEAGAAEEGLSCFALRGPSGAGAQTFLDALRERLEPARVVRVSGVPGALEPLGSLRLALLREHGSPEAAAESLGPTLGRVAVGEPVPWTEAVEAAAQAFGARPWFVVDPVPSVDGATLALLAEVAERGGAFFVARAPVDATLPPPLRALPFRDLVLPQLRIDDAKAVAQETLGDADEDIVRRVAVLGGDSPLGVMEAARALIAAGDLVHDGEHFVWRLSPRAGVRAIPLDALLQERLTALEPGPLRMLEAVCVLPLGTPPTLVEAVAARDGLDPDAQAQALGRLRQEAFLERVGAPAPTSEMLRRLVIQNMPPARQAELYRFCARAMGEAESCRGELTRGTRGFYRAEGGDQAAGARDLLAAAEAARGAAMERPARRLAAAAVQVHPTRETRTAAAAISRGAGGEREGEDVVERVSQVAVSALLSGDLDTVERTIEAAIAEGRDLAAADRVRAMAYLAKGETGAAMEAFRRAREKASGDDRTRARASLTLAWILLHAGNAEESIRAALDALAAARTLKDPRGEAAALHTLSACYKTLGRDEEAARIADASPA